MTQEFTPKRIAEYSDAELLTLTEEQINIIIDLECAYAGIQLLPDIPVAPEKPKNSNEDMTVYGLFDGLNFMDYEDAKLVLDFIVKNVDQTRMGSVSYTSGPGYQRKFCQSTDEFVLDDIKSQRVFSESRLKIYGAEIKKYEADKASYQIKKNTYDKIKKQRDDIINGLWCKIGSAQDAEHELNRLKQNAKRYMKLSGGVQEIAINFMVDAYKENEEMIRANFGAWAVDFVTEKMTEGDSVNG